ncbi:MAG: sigma 54-interacting transcriptional regulator [Verrucomicrobia bacterium]|nr:sigma 54-interacting transcriptional regulator [Verrucomicrobiota bacterium]
MKVLLTFTGSHDPFSSSQLQGESRSGPILSVLAERSFDVIYLFSTPRMAEVSRETQREIKTRYAQTKAQVLDVPLKDPTNYLGILRQLRGHFGRIHRDHAEAEYAIAVSSGTPQMHACWLMLAASGEIPATILQTTSPEFLPEGAHCVREIDLSAGEFPHISVRANQSLESSVEDDLASVRRDLGIVGDAPSFLKALGEAATYAEYDDIHVLLLGETGTGKECFTRLIHQLSSRSSQPLVTVNCSSIPSELAESQLFGHKKGSFTGASSDQDGKFKVADGGVLFLDELGELSLSAQAKLLRALEYGEIEPVGARKPVNVNVRVIAATNRDLRQRVSEGAFRQDLYQRFGATVTIPPLRQRKSDIPTLALHLLGEWNRRHQKQRSLSAKALNALSRHLWPGNIRELRRVILQSAMLCEKAVLSEKDLHFEIPVSSDPSGAVPEPDPGFLLNDYLDALKRRIIERALEKTGGIQAKAARLLGWSPQALNQYLRPEKHQKT